jgi:hypothetical protein
VPLVSWATLVAIAERLAPAFAAAGLGELEQRQRVDCVEAWVIAVLEQLCASPLLLATGAQQLDAPALLQVRLGELIGEHQHRTLPASGRS